MAPVRMSDSRETELLRELEAKDSEVSRLAGELERVTRENTILRGKINALVQRFFGSSSEQLALQSTAPASAGHAG